MKDLIVYRVRGSRLFELGGYGFAGIRLSSNDIRFLESIGYCVVIGGLNA